MTIERDTTQAAGAAARICVVTTTPLIVNFFLRSSLAALASRYDVTLVVNLEGAHGPDVDGINLTVVSAPIERKISILRDIAALWRLTRLFFSGRFKVVHSIAPKAGLLAMIAAWIARVPVRIHTFQGETWATRRGFMRSLLKFADRVVARFATNLLVVSASEQTFLVEQGVLREGQSRVLAHGSICGVDIGRFRADAAIRGAIRREFALEETDFVFAFLGRMTRDKGVLDLAEAFASMADQFPRAHLLIVGPDEECLAGEIRAHAGVAASRLRIAGMTAAPEDILAAADVVCLPSRREAFGIVIIEAAAAGLPAVASRIYGITDALIEGKTGLLHEPGSVQDLARQMGRLVDNPQLRQELGEAARERVHREFRQEMVIEALLKYYEAALPGQV